MSSPGGAGPDGELHNKLTVRAGSFHTKLEVPLVAHQPRPLLRVSLGARPPLPLPDHALHALRSEPRARRLHGSRLRCCAGV